MSLKNPVISVTGSSGAGTSTVKHTFEQIFRREGVTPATVEGDAFHRFNRLEMKKELEKRKASGDQTFSHFSYEANLLAELQELFKNYGETKTGNIRTYVHTKLRPKNMELNQVILLSGEKLILIQTLCSMRDYMVRL